MNINLLKSIKNSGNRTQITYVYRAHPQILAFYLYGICLID
jgi:hypothetical protein